MLPTFSSVYSKETRFKQPLSILAHLFLSRPKNNFTIEASLENPKTPLSSGTDQSHKELSLHSLSGIAKTLISECSHLWDANKGESFTNLSLKDYFLRLSYISPDTIRRFWRISVLKPRDVLDILLGFEFNRGKCDVEVKKVKSLWGIFMLASEQNREYEHLPQSCKIMAAMLVRVGLFMEVECVLSRRESQGILLDCQEIFSTLIEGYAGEFELDRVVSTFDRMRALSLVPSRSSYQALLKCLIELNETQLMYNVYVDMIKMEMGRSVQESSIHENAIRLLCMDGKLQEARDLVKKVMTFGIKPCTSVINAISYGYCQKKDFDCILSFFAEMRIAPDVKVSNKIIFSLCRNFGVEEASLFLQKLEEMGFCPDERTIGILIGFSCRERKLKKAFILLSEVLSRSFKPHVFSYNALLSGIFVGGMWTHSQDILVEMNEMGVTPNLSTFRVLLAGFSKAREFDKVKAVISVMAVQGLVKLTSGNDQLLTAFTLLGFNPFSVKIRRDNGVGFSKTEFCDCLGNGLYLDTDLDKYEKMLDKVLDDAMIPDFDSFILEDNCGGDIKNTLAMVDEMARWGQELSLPALSTLLRRLPRASFSVKTINHLLDNMFKSVYQLDQQALNKIIHVYGKKRLTFMARVLFDGMIQRGLPIENGTYSSLLFALCKKNDLRGFRHCHQLARKYNWSPELEDGNALLSYLCEKKWLDEALMLFETLLLVNPNNMSNTFQTFLEELCCKGFTSTALVLLEKFPKNHAVVLDHMAYSNLICGFCKEKRFPEAFVILDFMLVKNLTPPLDVSIQLIPQLCRTNNSEKAVALKDICLKEQPSALVSINCALINGFCKLGRVEEAATLFKETLLKGLVPDVEAFNLLIQGFCRSKKLRKVMELLGVMTRKSLSISISSYSSMVHLLCTERMFSQALSLKELVHKENNLPDIVMYNILIFYLSSTENISLLDAVIHELQKKGLQFDKVTYNFLIQGFIWCKDVSRSLQYLMTMIRQDLQPSNRSFQEVIDYLCCNGELKKALNLSQEMEVRGWIHCSIIQNKIVQTLLNHGKLHEAEDFLDRMEFKGLVPDNIKYDYLIKQFSCHGRLNKAVDLLNIMLRKGSIPGGTCYDCIIQGFSNCPMLDLALDFHTEMLYRDLKPSMITWEILVHRLCEDGQVAEAEKLLKSMIQFGETPKREMFCAVINKYQSGKNINKASELLKVMQQMGYVPDFDTHWSLISNLGNSSKKEDKSPNRSFLSSLLSEFGFGPKNSNDNVGVK